MKRIDSLAQLKQAAAYDEHQPTAVFFILLKGGVRSRKHIVYFPDTDRFDVFHAAGDCWEEGLTGSDLVEKTSIGPAMVRGAFFWEPAEKEQ